MRVSLKVTEGRSSDCKEIDADDVSCVIGKERRVRPSARLKGLSVLRGKCARRILRGRGGSNVALLPDHYPIPRRLTWISCNLARRRYIPFPKLLILKVNEFCR